VRVTMVDKNKAVVCCLLATSAIMLSEKKKRKRKMCSKKWYLKRNISCDAHLLNEVLETNVPWNDATVVSAGKVRKLWNSLSELRSSVWKTTGKDSCEACAIACENCAVYSVFRQVWRHTVKSFSLTENAYGALSSQNLDSFQKSENRIYDFLGCKASSIRSSVPKRIQWERCNNFCPYFDTGFLQWPVH
jgi:hypothetical protein